MAAAIYNKLTETDDAFSAGTYVGVRENPESAMIEQFFRTTDFFELMEKHGIFIRENLTQKLLPEMLGGADIIVSMAEEPFIPDFLRKAKNVIWWDVENPKFVTKEVAEKIFDEVFKLVEKLIQKNLT
jgi:protein-tyrosine-phosphatase